MAFKVLVTGGGTSGHISPALALIATLRELEPETQFLYLGSASGLEKKQVETANVPFRAISTGKLRRYFSVSNLIDQGRIPVGVLQSLWHVARFRPDAILATGGYVSVPPVVAGALLRVPILIHEQTVQVGLANRINARFASKIALSWESSRSSLPAKLRAKSWVSGNPLRPSIWGGVAERAIPFFGLSDENLPVVYVTGGSLGARVLNRAVEEALPQLLEKSRVIHQCGEQANENEKDYDRLTRARLMLPETLQKRYAVTRFVRDELRDVFALADLVVSRAGAGTLSELCALGLPALYVPLVPTGGDEQTKNARMAVEAGAARVLRQEECDGKALYKAIEELLSQPRALREMGENAKPLSRPGAAREIAREVLDLIRAVPQTENFERTE